MNLQKAIEHGPVEIVDFPMNSVVIFHSKMLVHWIGLRENLKRKPMGFYHQIDRACFPVKIFPSSNSMNGELLMYLLN